MFYRSSIAVIAPDLVRDLKLDTAQLSTVSAAFFYSYAVIQIPIGILLDRLRPVRIMIPLYALAATGTLIFAWSETAGLMTLGRFLMGIGMGCSFVGALKILSVRFSADRFATLASVVVAVGGVGTILSTSPLAYSAAVAGWRSTFTGIALFHMVFIALFLLAAGPPAPMRALEVKKAAFPRIRSSLRHVLESRDFWLISMCTFCRSGVLIAVQGLWAGPFLIDALHFTPLEAGNILLLTSVSFILCAPPGGWLSDRVFRSRKAVMSGALAGMALTLAAMAFLSPDSPASTAAVFLFLGVFASTGGLPYAHLKELMPPELTGTAITAMNFFAILGMGVFMQGIGLFMTAFSPGALTGAAFSIVFLLCAAVLFAAFFLYLFTTDSHFDRR